MGVLHLTHFVCRSPSLACNARGYEHMTSECCGLAPAHCSAAAAPCAAAALPTSRLLSPVAVGDGDGGPRSGGQQPDVIASIQVHLVRPRPRPTSSYNTHSGTVSDSHSAARSDPNRRTSTRTMVWPVRERGFTHHRRRRCCRPNHCDCGDCGAPEA